MWWKNSLEFLFSKPTFKMFFFFFPYGIASLTDSQPSPLSRGGMAGVDHAEVGGEL